MKAVVDGFQIFNWSQFPGQDELRDTISEFFGQIPFYGNKVLKLEKELDTAWYHAYFALAKAVTDFFIERCDGIAEWNGKDDAAGAEAFFKSLASGSAAPAQAATAAPVKQEVKAAPAKAAPAKPAAKKVKAPVKELKGGRQWSIENHVGTTLNFSGEEEVRNGIFFDIFGCKETTIVIDGKCKSVSVDGSQKVNLYVDKLMTDVSITNSKQVKVYAKTQVPFISIETSSEVQVILTNATRNTKIQTTCSRSIFVKYPKEGHGDEDEEEEHWEKQPIAELYETVIKGDSVVTTPAESLE